MPKENHPQQPAAQHPTNRELTMSTALLVRYQIAIARLREDRGAAMAEYGLLLAMVALAAIGILVFFGGELVEIFTESEAKINDRGNVPAAD